MDVRSYCVALTFCGNTQDGHLLDSKSQKFSFRRVRVVQEELEGQEGRSFLFEVNNIRIFCGGRYLTIISRQK